MGPTGPINFSITLADDVLSEGLLAIFALHPHHAFHFAHPEVAVHRLVVGDAVGVGAVEHSGDELRQLQLVLLHHIEVFDDVDGRFRGEQRQLVGLLLGQAGVLNLDEILFAQRAGFQVEADGDPLLGFNQLEQLEDLDALASGDVIDDGAVTDGFDLQLVLVRHDIPLSSDSFVQYQCQQRLACIDPVLRLLEVASVGGLVDRHIDLVDAGQGMQDLHGGLGPFQSGQLQHELGSHVLVFGLVEALFLDAGHVEDVQLRHHLFHGLVDAERDAFLFQFFADVVRHCQCFRGDEEEAAVEQAEGLGQRVHGAAVFQVTDEGDVEVVQTTLGLMDGEQVEQGLARMLVGAVAAVDDRHAGKLGSQTGRALFRVAHHHRIRVGADDLDGVSQGLALLGAGVATVGEADDVAAEALYRGLEREAGAGGGFEEAAGNQLVFQQAGVRFSLQPLCG